MIGNLFHSLFYQPLLNALVLLYQFIPGQDFGMAILLLTLLVRALLYPLNLQSIKSQRALLKLEPLLKEIKEKFKGDKEKIAKETMELYKKVKINPFSGLFLVLLQLPILLALYKVFTQGVAVEEWQHLYSFIANPGEIKPMFFFVDLASPNFVLAGFAGALQFLQAKMQNSDNKTKAKTKAKTKDVPDFSQMLQKQMLYFLPTFTFVILLKIPSAIALYLIASTVFSIWQTSYVKKKEDKNNSKGN